MKRRFFLKRAAYGAAALSGTSLFAARMRDFKLSKELKISLAQWSLHRSFERGELDPVDFASITIEKYGLNAVEYVNGFYSKNASDESFWSAMKTRAVDAGVKNLLIMVDDEGNLGVANDAERKNAVENHYKWIHAAKILGCHSVRVNAFGDAERATYRNAIIDGMGRLADYAAKENINIIIENHGLFSSDADLIVDIIQQVNKPNFGSFPDFGNWCLSAKWGSTQIACEKAYDRFQGVSELLPYARAVSAKSYNFNENGEDRTIDYYKMLKIVKESGYQGYVGIEYEGTELNEHDGILATKTLMERVWGSI
jgi:sugar phosphate isomerase/epimerase